MVLAHREMLQDGVGHLLRLVGAWHDRKKLAEVASQDEYFASEGS